MKQCISCQDSQAWDPVIEYCFSCPDGTNMDADKLLCIQAEKQCPGNKIFNSLKEVCECPASSPYWNNY